MASLSPSSCCRLERQSEEVDTVEMTKALPTQEGQGRREKEGAHHCVLFWWQWCLQTGFFSAFPGRSTREERGKRKFLNGETDATSSELHPPLGWRLGAWGRRCPAAGVTEQSALPGAW